MKVKTKIFSLVLAVLLIFPAIMLSACKEKTPEPEYAWGKTFKYDGVMISNKDSYSDGGMTHSDLIISEYNKNNLDFSKVSVNGIERDFSSLKGNNANEFYENICEFANTYLSSTLNSEFVVVFGSEEEKIVTIKGITYKLIPGMGTDYYNICSSSDTTKIVGSVCVDISKNINNFNTAGCVELSLYDTSIIAVSNCYMSIPTIEICFDPTADKTYNDDVVIETSLSMNFYPFLSKA